MTGYGRAEVRQHGLTAIVEIRSVNSRYLEITARLPRSLAQRERELKELVRTAMSRGGLTIAVTVEEKGENSAPMVVNKSAARSYVKLLNELRKSARIKEQVKLEHLLKFSEVFEVNKEEESDETTWRVVEEAIRRAMEDLNSMRIKEGAELAKDLERRIRWMDEIVGTIERLSKERLPLERDRLNERIGLLLQDKDIIDQHRLELEVALLADKLDVTEECVRFRSHNKFFLEAMAEKEPAGRKLNFLVQEINREANTIGSKTSDAEIAHLVVKIKEELEKIREQLQNIE
jgi:uncharacterized protein (TIGR00255 family)